MHVDDVNTFWTFRPFYFVLQVSWKYDCAKFLLFFFWGREYKKNSRICILDRCHFQKNKDFFSFRNINNKTLNSLPNGSKAIFCKGESEDRQVYFKLKLVTHTQRRFVIDFPVRNLSCRLTIRRFLQRFRKTGCMTNANKGHSGRPRSAGTAINTETVRQRLEESSRKSTRCLSQKTSPQGPLFDACWTQTIISFLTEFRFYKLRKQQIKKRNWTFVETSVNALKITSVSCDKHLVDFLGDSSRRCLTVSVLIAVLADLHLPPCPLSALVTHPVSLNFCRRRLINVRRTSIKLLFQLEQLEDLVSTTSVEWNILYLFYWYFTSFRAYTVNKIKKINKRNKESSISLL